MTVPAPGHPRDLGLLLMRVSPRLAGHLAIAVHDYRKRCAATGTPAPLTDLDELFEALRRVNQGQPGSPIDSAVDGADAAPVTPRLLTIEQDDRRHPGRRRVVRDAPELSGLGVGLLSHIAAEQLLVLGGGHGVPSSTSGPGARALPHAQGKSTCIADQREVRGHCGDPIEVGPSCAEPDPVATAPGR